MNEPKEFEYTTGTLNKKSDYFDDNGLYIEHFGIHKDFCQIYGNKPEDIFDVKISVAENQERTESIGDKVDYWGWWCFEQKRFTMIYAQYFLLNMCFPSGIKTSEERNQGKAYRLKIVKI